MTDAVCTCDPVYRVTVYRVTEGGEGGEEKVTVLEGNIALLMCVCLFFLISVLPKET